MIRRTEKLPSRQKAAGFTLLEVLLAFVVFALSFTAILEILSGAMRNTVRAKHMTEAALITQSVMDQVGLDIPLENGTRVNGESGDYQWELQISEFEGTDEVTRTSELSELTGIELLEIEFLISWGVYPREQSNRFYTVKATLPDLRGAKP